MSEEVKKIRTLADLQAIKAAQLPNITPAEGTRIVIGLGTCGIAAGARPVYAAVEKALADAGLTDSVRLEATGCVGICQFEPVMEVYTADGTRTTYVHMTAETAARVVQQHVRGGNPLPQFTIGASMSRR